MHIGVNKRTSWLVKGIEMKAYIPNLVGERYRGENSSYEKNK